MAADPDLRGVDEVVDAEQAGCLGAEDDGGVVGGGSVEESAVSKGGAECGWELGFGCGKGDAEGVDGRDERVAVDVGVLEGGDLGYVA